MAYELSGLLLPQPVADYKPIDAELHQSLQDAHTSMQPLHSVLRLDTECVRVLEKDFTGSGYACNPDLTLDPAISLDSLLACDKPLKDWQEKLAIQVAEGTVDVNIASMYRWRSHEDRARVQVLLASRTNHTAGFKGWNEYIYGELDGVLFGAAVDRIARDAEAITKDATAPDALIHDADNVQIKLASIRGNSTVLTPSQAVFDAVREDHYKPGGYYPLLLVHVVVPQTVTIDLEKGRPVVNQILHNIGLPLKIVPTKAAAFGVRNDVGEMRYPLVRERFIGLVAGHEVGSHGLEYSNAQRGPIRLLADGLDRYERGNEGRAVLREQVVYEMCSDFAKTPRWRDILRRYVALSIASGLGDIAGRPQTFSETYAFINSDRMYTRKANPTMTTDELIEKAHHRTWSLLRRELKGTDGTDGAYLKDKVYLEGNVASWQMATLLGSKAIADGDIGKYDIANPRHRWYLQQAGIPLATTHKDTYDAAITQ